MVAEAKLHLTVVSAEKRCLKALFKSTGDR